MNTCSPASLEDFKLVPKIARQAICTLYSGLQDLQTKQNRGAYTFVSQLVRLGPLLVTILSYESFRQRSFWRRRGASLYLILAQVLSGAVSVPLYFATLCHGESNDTKGKKQEESSLSLNRFGKAEGWSIFASVTLGYLAPLAYGVLTNWSNKAITTFLCFPLFIMTINSALPALLHRFNDHSRTAHLPLLVTSGITMLLSLDGHIKLLFSASPFRHIFCPSHTTIGMSQDLHILLLHDYAFVLLEIASFLFLYTYRHSTRREKTKAARIGILVGLLAGPVAGLTAIWASNELRELNESSSLESSNSAGDSTERRSLMGDSH